MHHTEQFPVRFFKNILGTVHRDPFLVLFLAPSLDIELRPQFLGVALNSWVLRVSDFGFAQISATSIEDIT